MATEDNTTKICSSNSKCLNPLGSELPATSEYFSPDKRNKSGFQAKCKVCCAEWQLTYRKESPERVKANEVNRNRDKRLSSQKRQYNRTGREQRKLYVIRHPERVRASAQKQRAKRLKAPGEYTGHDLLRLFKGQGGKCWWCSCKLRNGFEVDHRIPLSRGGSNSIGNLVVSCMPCNRSKHDKLPSEWSGRLL